MDAESTLSSLNFTQKLCKIEPVEISFQTIPRLNVLIKLTSQIESDQNKSFILC